MSEKWSADTTEVDPVALAERRELWLARLAELRPDFGPADWRRAARAQLVFWIGRKAQLPVRFRSIIRAPHGLSPEETFAAFFCHEPEDSPDYFEIPFLFAVAEGDQQGIRDTAEALGLKPDELSRDLFRGPFIPISARNPTSR